VCGLKGSGWNGGLRFKVSIYAKKKSDLIDFKRTQIKGGEECQFQIK